MYKEGRVVGCVCGGGGRVNSRQRNGEGEIQRQGAIGGGGDYKKGQVRRVNS